MSASPFTPGDWIADEKRLVVATADWRLDVAMVFDDGTCPADQLKADVHLLAAAKALYEALTDGVRSHEPCIPGHCWCDLARAALAQAEGRP